MNAQHQIADRVADAAGTAGVLIPAVATIAQVNDYLQAGAFVVGIISGLCAAYYYVKKANTK